MFDTWASVTSTRSCGGAWSSFSCQAIDSGPSVPERGVPRRRGRRHRWAHSGSSQVAPIVDAADSPTLVYRFYGDRVTWVYSTCSRAGIARVYVDDVEVGTVDQYSFAVICKQQTVFSGFAPDAYHVIKIVSTGQHSAGSDYVICHDRFEAPAYPDDPTPVAEGNLDGSTFVTWAIGHSGQASDGAFSYTPALSMSAAYTSSTAYTFSGESVTWYYGTGPTCGKARVLIDGRLQPGLVDQFSPTLTFSETTRVTYNDLGQGLHTILITGSGTRNTLSAAYGIVSDAFSTPAPADPTGPPLTLVQAEVPRAAVPALSNLRVCDASGGVISQGRGFDDTTIRFSVANSPGSGHFAAWAIESKDPHEQHFIGEIDAVRGRSEYQLPWTIWQAFDRRRVLGGDYFIRVGWSRGGRGPVIDSSSTFHVDPDYVVSDWQDSLINPRAGEPIYTTPEGVVDTYPDGTVVNVFPQRLASEGHFGNSSRIMMRTSDDNGETWSRPSLVYDDEYDDRCLSGGVIGERLVIFFSRQLWIPDPTDELDGGDSVFIDWSRICSTDRGATWQGPATVATDWVGFGKPVHVPGVGYCQSAYGSERDPNNWDQNAYFVSADGDRWDGPRYVGSEGQYGLSEPTSAYGDGLWVWASRHEPFWGWGPGNAITLSTDSGQTWSPPDMYTMVPPCYVPGGELIFQRGHFLLFTLRRYGDGGGLPKAFVYESTAARLRSSVSDWSLVAELDRPDADSGSPSFYGYPTVAELADGRLLCLMTDDATADCPVPEYSNLYQFYVTPVWAGS